MKPCFDKLSTNGENPTKAMPALFALSLLKGELRSVNKITSRFWLIPAEYPWIPGLAVLARNDELCKVSSSGHPANGLQGARSYGSMKPRAPDDI